MANSNTKETRKLQAAKKEKANEKAKTVKKVKACLLYTSGETYDITQ